MQRGRVIAAIIAGAVSARMAGVALGETSPPATQPTTPAPADSGFADPSLVAMRARLLKIFEAHDLPALRRYLHPRINFGRGVIGTDALFKLGGISQEEWEVYAAAVRRGGRAPHRGLFIAYHAEKDPARADFRIDPAKTVEALHPLATVHAAPNPRARILNADEMGVFISEARLLPSPPGTPPDWVLITGARFWPPDRKGFIRREDIVAYSAPSAG